MLSNYGENFEYRELVSSSISSLQLYLYPQLMFVNKTDLHLFYKKQLYQPRSNDYLWVDGDKLVLKIPGYGYGEEIELKKAGTGGVLTFRLENKQEAAGLGPKILKHIQLAYTLSRGNPYPFNRTLFLSVTPRFTLLNRTGRLLIMMQH